MLRAAEGLPDVDHPVVAVQRVEEEGERARLLEPP
jgi:hypothetical protein